MAEFLLEDGADYRLPRQMPVTAEAGENEMGEKSAMGGHGAI